jgi:hypothetical protein
MHGHTRSIGILRNLPEIQENTTLHAKFHNNNNNNNTIKVGRKQIKKEDRKNKGRKKEK